MLNKLKIKKLQNAYFALIKIKANFYLGNFVSNFVSKNISKGNIKCH